MCLLDLPECAISYRQQALFAGCLDIGGGASPSKRCIEHLNSALGNVWRLACCQENKSPGRIYRYVIGHFHQKFSKKSTLLPILHYDKLQRLSVYFLRASLMRMTPILFREQAWENISSEGGWPATLFTLFWTLCLVSIIEAVCSFWRSLLSFL